MDDKSGRSDYPDLSGVFDIDDSMIPDKMIERDPDAVKIHEPILTSDAASRYLPDEARKAIEKDKKEKKKQEKRKNRRIKTIIALSSVLAVLLISIITGIVLTDMKTPEVSTQKPVIETISRYHTGNAVTVKEGNSLFAVFIDNDYDVHYIEKGQTVELKTAEGIIAGGTVTDIKELSADSVIIEKYHSMLTSQKPSTSVYAVYISVADDALFSSEGIALEAKVLTKTAFDAMTLPSSAVVMNGNKHYVYVYSSFRHMLTMKEVNVGITVDGKTEIIRGIKKSDRIAVSFSCPVEQLYDGIRVKTK